MTLLLQMRPIVSALKSHRSAVVLLVLEIALTMAVLGNLVFVVLAGVQRAHTPSGIAEHEVGVIQSIGVIGFKDSSSASGNLAALRAVPGVVDAAFGGPPLWYAQRVPVFRDAARSHRALRAYEFQGSQGLSRTLGLHIVRGRDFNDDELPTTAQEFSGKGSLEPVLITHGLAAKLFGDADPIGRTLYDGMHDMRVIGELDHLRGEITGRTDDDDSIVSEFRVGSEQLGGGFMIRSRPDRLPRVLQAAAAALRKASPGHVQVKVFTFDELRARYFRGDLATGRILVAIMLVLLIVTTLGVTGLASFWVQQRRRQIGMRRALGATRGDILRYFQLENFLIVGAGVLLGAVCTFGLNVFLMRHFELPRLPSAYFVAGALVVWLLGQLAVLGPALRAAAVPPVVATRSV